MKNKTRYGKLTPSQKKALSQLINVYGRNKLIDFNRSGGWGFMIMKFRPLINVYGRYNTEVIQVGVRGGWQGTNYYNGNEFIRSEYP